MPNYTTEELIQYLYKEMSQEESSAIELELENDWTLKERLEALKDSQRDLDSIIKSPRRQSVMAILDYARNSVEVEQS